MRKLRVAKKPKAKLTIDDDFDKFYKAFVISSLRRASYRWPPRYRAMNKARVTRGKYQCILCGNIVGRKDIKVDHLLPVVDPERGFINFDEYCKRLFCHDDNFQAICRGCHKVKTLNENIIRRQAKKALLKSTK